MKKNDFRDYKQLVWYGQDGRHRVPSMIMNWSTTKEYMMGLSKEGKWMTGTVTIKS